MMSSVGKPTGVYDVNGLGKYRAERWDQSQAENSNFFFGPKTLLIYGAASFLYEVYPSSKGTADQGTIESFFGTVPNPGSPGGFASIGERIPPNWFSRSEPYGLVDIAEQIVKMYRTFSSSTISAVATPRVSGAWLTLRFPSTTLLSYPHSYTHFQHPVVSPRLFGGNTASGSFDALGTFANGAITGGNIASLDPNDVVCLLYQLIVAPDCEFFSPFLRSLHQVLFRLLTFPFFSSIAI
jgi:hypothetical protein